MSERENSIDRRNFLKKVGAAGLGSVLASTNVMADANEPNVTPKAESGKEQKPKMPQVPKRKLGKTGLEVPVLSLGTIFDVLENQIVLRKAFEYGVTCWDTASGYTHGNSELGIGKFISKNPKSRKKLIIVTKASRAKNAEGLEKRLQESLKRMNTDYIDIYYGVHGLGTPFQLTDELKQWAESAKKRKLIKFFGFSTHANMARCLKRAAEVGWVDVIMPKYNFKLMQDEEMQAAIEACHKAGIGLIAMKTQAQSVETEEDKKLAGHFLKKGFTTGQAKIKAVLQDERISSACVGRENVKHLMENIAAVLDKTKLSREDMRVLTEYAQDNCSGYCAGCTQICEQVADGAPVGDVMRYLMYYNNYGAKDEARELFAQLPAQMRNRLAAIDYSTAEARCPQRLAIGRLMNEAVRKLV